MVQMLELRINIDKLEHNIATLSGFCASKGLEMVGVLKYGHSLPLLLEQYQRCGIKAIAFSRVQPVAGMKPSLSARPVLIGLCLPRQASDVVSLFSASFHSEILTIRALAKASSGLVQRHGIYMLVDIGDLREGILPEDVPAHLEKIRNLFGDNFKLYGLAANLGCASGTLPDENNLRILDELAVEIEQSLGLPVPKISIGGTVVYPWLLDHAIPQRINQLRLGEGILCGHSPGYDAPIEGLNDDVFLFSAEVLEVKEKYSPPEGARGTNAFGHPPSLGPPGKRRRAILEFGLVDTITTGLVPVLPGVQIITSSSEYTVLDVTDCPERIGVSTRITFKTNYEALTRTLLSPVVNVICAGERSFR
jgi:predicted amino acid racemase